MRVSNLLGLITLAMVASAAAISPIVFQPQQVSEGVVPGATTTVRVSNLGFADYNAANNYTGYFCETPAELVAVNVDMAVVRLTTRPKPSLCKLAIWDLATEKRVHLSVGVLFTDSPYNDPDNIALDVVPSFYFGSRPAATRVRVIGKGFRDVTMVTGANGEGDCSAILITDDGFSCNLPVIPDSLINLNRAVEFHVFLAASHTRFAIQALKDEAVNIVSISAESLHSGSRFNIKLDAPLSSADKLPWVPVLVHSATGQVEDGAVFSGVSWDADGDRKTLSAAITCTSCRPGKHAVHLGDAVPGTAGSVIASDVTVQFNEPECIFLGRPVPDVLSADEIRAGQGHMFASLDLTAAPRAVYQATVGDSAIPLKTTFSGNAAPNSGTITLSPTTETLPVGRHLITVSILTPGGRVLQRCTIPDALEVTPSVAGTGAPIVTGAPKRFFTVGAYASERITLTFTGANLGAVAKVLMVFPGREIKPTNRCKIASATSTAVGCSIETNEVYDIGVFDWVFYDAAGTELTRRHGFFSHDGPEIVTYDPPSVTVGVVQRVVVTMPRATPPQIPVQLALMGFDNVTIASSAQWTRGGVAVFADVDFSFPGRAFAVIRGRYPGADEELGYNVATYPLGVEKGEIPLPAVASVYPAFLQVSAVDAAAPTVLQIDVTHYARVADRVACVTVGGQPAEIISREGTLLVSAELKSIVGNVTVSLLGQDGAPVVGDSFFTIEDDLPSADGKPFYVRPGTSYAVPYGSDGQITVEIDLVNVSDEPVTMSTDTGSIVSQTRVDYGGFARISSVIAGCDDCVGRRVTLSVALTDAPQPGRIRSAVLVVRQPAVTHVWPSSKLDFSTSTDCLPYAVMVDEVNPRHVFALSFPKNLGVKVVSTGLDVATSTYTGCLVCDGCIAGTFEAGLVVPFTGSDSGAMSIPRKKFTITPSKLAAVSSAAAAAADGASAGLNGAEIAAIAAAGFVLLAAAAAAVLAWRRRGARKQSAELTADLLATESASV
jgi:hypothetical protein